MHIEKGTSVIINGSVRSLWNIVGAAVAIEPTNSEGDTYVKYYNRDGIQKHHYVDDTLIQSTSDPKGGYLLPGTVVIVGESHPDARGQPQVGVVMQVDGSDIPYQVVMRGSSGVGHVFATWAREKDVKMAQRQVEIMFFGDYILAHILEGERAVREPALPLKSLVVLTQQAVENSGLDTAAGRITGYNASNDMYEVEVRSHDRWAYKWLNPAEIASTLKPGDEVVVKGKVNRLSLENNVVWVKIAGNDTPMKLKLSDILDLL